MLNNDPVEEARKVYEKTVRNLEKAKAQTQIIKKLAGTKDVPIISLLNNIIMTNIKTVYGVENLKKVITYLGGQLINAFNIDTDGDGNVSTYELIQYGLATVATVPGVLPSFTASDDEIKDLSNEEIGLLVDHVLDTEFLPDDRERAEHYVKSLIYVLNVNRQMVSFSVKFFAGEDVRFDPLEGLL